MIYHCLEIEHSTSNYTPSKAVTFSTGEIAVLFLLLLFSFFFSLETIHLKIIEIIWNFYALFEWKEYERGKNVKQFQPLLGLIYKTLKFIQTIVEYLTYRARSEPQQFSGVNSNDLSSSTNRKCNGNLLQPSGSPQTAVTYSDCSEIATAGIFEPQKPRKTNILKFCEKHKSRQNQRNIPRPLLMKRSDILYANRRRENIFCGQVEAPSHRIVSR